MLRFRLTTSCAITLYALCVAIALGVADFVYTRTFFPPIQPTSAGTTGLPNRLAWYKANTAKYNLIFLGDSRTYCGIHAELLDPLLHTSSINLASFANWLPTQFPLIQDLISSVPRETTVVWTIGEQNFLPSTGIQRVYPVGFINAVRYVAWGLGSASLLDNLAFYNPALYFLTQRGEIRQRFLNALDQKSHLSLLSIPRALAAPSALSDEPLSNDQVQKLKREYALDPNVAYVSTVEDNGRINSLVVYFRRGSYYRVELDHAYFRRKQQEMTGRWSETTNMHPGYRTMFEEILRMFKSAGIKLVVNEIEEAPFIYGGTQSYHRKFMRDTIEKTVREYGFPYTRIDFDQLTDEDYFDYNHLNDRGARTFIPLLAEQLRPLVRAFSESDNQLVKSK